MKKLLSICFLSILLGLLSFSTQAQSNTGSSCASGFWIENLQPTTIHEIANLPADMPNTGDLPLTHTLGQLWYGSTGQYLGNAHPGQTELYELHFCNTCGLDPKTKVSIDWLVIRDGDTINDNLSDYMEFSIYTFYNQLNQYGACQSIGWLGGQVNDGFGYCEPVNPSGYTLYDSIHGLNTGCHVPTNYPGALQVQQGYPVSVLTQLNEVVPAMGLNHIYTEALDYFYLDFFMQTRNIVQIKWKQVGDYKLVMRIRERVGGTPYMNLNWNQNETTDFIGGHQSCCGNVIAEDVINFPSFGETCMEVCENETFTTGRPAYTFTQTTPDTNVVFGQYVFDGTNCKYFQADSIYKFHFYERHTPQVVVNKAVDTFCRCESFTTAQLAQMISFDQQDLQYASDHYFLWNHGTASNPDWRREFPTLNNNLGTHTYQVLQQNVYSICGVDTLCTGNPVTLTITFVEMQVPTIAAPNVEFCLDWIAADNTLQFTATSTPDPRCATTTRWYRKMNAADGSSWYQWIPNFPNYRKLANLDTNTRIPGQGNNLAVNLADFVPSTNKDTVLYFFATSYDPVLDCESPNFSFITVKLYQTPVLAPSISKTVYCPGSEVEMQVTINNGTSYSAPDYTYRWGGDVTEVKLDGTRVPATAMQVKTVGTGTYNSSYLPLNSYNKRTYSQQIFTPAEVGTGIISKIAFQNATTGTLANYVRDVKIYLALSDDETFSTNSTYGKEWCTEGMQLVYQGQLDCRKSTEEWLEVPFTTPYQYDGSKNLVVVVHDQTNGYASGVKFLATAKSQAAMYATADGLAPNPADIAKGSRNVYGYRNNIKFYVESEGFTTSAKNQYAYYQMDPTDSCKTAYTTTAYVIDGHGCKSAPVSFNYIANDTVNPTVSVATVTTNVNACHLNTTNAPIYTTVAELEAGANVTFSDNCDHQFLHIDGVTSVVNSISDTTCHEVVTRTYTIKDHCGNPVTFTHVFMTQDNEKPQFVAANGTFPYVRLMPVEGGNCTFNSPDSMDFVNAVAPFVYDNCTDSAYLMSTLKFNWENTNESPIGKTNIFLERNHLTVEATITDRCGNSKKQLVIYIDRPDKIQILPNGITANANICFNDTVHMTFDPSFIKDDTIMGPFVPYTYKWSEKNGKTGVHFSDDAALTTNITFDAPGDYVFVMTVTDRNGCSAESEPINVNVRALPNVVINHIVLNGQTEPYCPTYGNLTVRAEIVNPVAGQTVAANAYQWVGESVNIHSDSARTWVTITPEYCDTIYPYYVVVTDDRQCVGIAHDTIDVATAGPQFIGTIADTTVEKQAGCVFRIPDFKDLVDAALVQDECYTFSQIKYSDAFGTIERSDWYSQSPAKNTLLTENSQVVTITVKNPCGKTATLNVNVLKPTDVLAVTITPTIDSLCQEEILTTGVDYTATVVNELPAGSETYNWELIVKPTGSTATIPTVHNAATLTVQQALEAGVYQYKVNVVDGLGCTASATADLYVKFQGADPIVRTWPNTLCERYNGALAVDTTPNAYVYILEPLDHASPAITKISDVPVHQTTPWNTIVFDSLRPTSYQLTVITDEGCERVHQPYIIPDARQGLEPTVFTKTDVSVCTNDNGTITITPRANYAYSLYYTANDSLVGTGVSYSGLSVGQYRIHSVNTVTHCVKDTIFNLTDIATRPEVAATPSANTNCVNTSYNNNPENVFNGQINITSSANWHYTVYTIANDTILNDTLNSSNNPIKNLAPTTYKIVAYNPATGCSTLTPKTVSVGTNTTTPTINHSMTPNHYCSIDTADGSITVTNSSNFRQLSLLKKIGTFSYDTIDYRSTAHSWSPLYDATYFIEGIGNNYCRATKTVDVTKVTTNPTITATSTMNPSCVADLGTITAKNTKTSVTMASYQITSGSFTKDTLTSSNTVVFNGMASGDYTVKGVTTYGCSATDTVTVQQYQAPAMQLTMTPNHMCEPTFEKPGDGTIKIVAPHETAAHPYVYKFYDAAGNEMTVPYDLPLTHTKYWLAAGAYHVVALDTLTGCTTAADITVTNDYYTVDFDYTTTANYICGTSTVGNGSITVVNPTSTNPDAVFAYSLDGITYQTSPTFTALKDGTYNVYVKDTTMQCLLSKPVAVSATDSCAPVLTICDNNGVCGDQFDYCYDAAGIQLCGTVNDTCNPSNIYTYGWYAPCANPHASNTACIDVQTNHYVVNGCDYIFTATNTATGCTYSKTVNVAIHPNPQLKFTINGVDAATDHTNAYCENEELHIAVHALNSTEVVLDTTSIEWTLPAFIAGTGFADFYIKGDTITPDNITFCVRANSKFGCPSIIYSLPVSFKRIAHVTVDLTDQCVSCTLPYGEVITKPTTATYPYSTTRVHTYTSVLTGCDSIVTYNITLIAAPEFTGTPTVAAFCEDEHKHLSDFAGYTVEWNGQTGTEKWYAAVGTGTYTKVTAVADITEGNYVITNANGDRVMLNTTVSSGVALQAGTTVELSNPPASNIWTLVKNSDNTYSFYNAAIGKYIAGVGGSANEVELVNTNTADRAKWNITITGANTRVENVAYSGRYLMYNESSPRFATYSGTQKWLSLYKGSSPYAEVTTDPELTYDYVTTHTIKRVAENSCGTDEEILDLHDKVYKKPSINTFNVSNPYCASKTYDFTANVSSYGTQATAKLYIEGNTTPLATTTFNGLNQTITFSGIVTPWSYDNKTLTLEVVNTNGFCDAVTSTNTLNVDTAMITGLANNHTYCVNDQMTLADFTGITPANYSTLTWYHMLGANPAPSSDDAITLSYTFINRSMNGEKVYVVASNTCYTQIISNPVTIHVNAKPVVTAHTDINQCSSAFTTMPAMTITWNEPYDATTCDSGWVLRGTSGAYAAATFNEIKAAAICPNVAHVGYFAHGFCGNDTTFFDITLATDPTVSLAIGTQCPSSYVWNTLTTNTMSYNCSPAASNSETWTFTKADASTTMTWTNPSSSTITFNDLVTLGYDGGTLTHSVTNCCGTTTASVTINVLTNTFTAPTYQASCKGDTLGAFVATAPSWTGTATVTSEGWEVLNGSTWTPATLATVINTIGQKVRYHYATNCGDDFYSTPTGYTLTVNDKPELTVKTSIPAICEGLTIDPKSAINTVTYHGNEDKYDTTYTVNGATVDASTIYSYADNNKWLVVTITDNGQACGSVKDSVQIKVNPRPNPTITGPAEACADAPLTTPFTASTGYINYVFNVVGDATPSITVPTTPSTSNTFDPTFSLSTSPSSAHDTVYVTVEDPTTHCVGTSSTPAIIRITNAPSFIFSDMSGTKTHSFTLADTGMALQYKWAIGTKCYTPNPLVYVEYDIYHNDTLISNVTVGKYLSTKTAPTAMGVPGKPYVTSNELSWCANYGAPRTETIYYNYAVANPTAADNGNHFPYSTLNEGSGHDYFDDFYLKFLAERPDSAVTATVVPFRVSGEYKIVYRLMATSHEETYNYYYSPSCGTGDLLKIGGKKALTGTVTLLAIDSINITVGGTATSVSADPIDDEVVAPEMAPVISDVEQVAPDMEVWPNPAPAVETTLKARVHNMSGNATVTLTSLTGKQVYNGKIFIDNDNYYFEFNVNSLSVGSYIMTVRTDTDVITKKVIVSRLAK
ncbi:MAG: T9SS type A sorting domain-containing protein [Bacteroidales bacterium]|nr:T9SS type A sorting domain-containing protein [Bacteroidales bacterium]